MDRGREALTCGILAGGGSRRFGSDKAKAVWRGRSLLEWTIRGARTITEDIHILSKDPRIHAPLAADLGVGVVEDLHGVSTPLSGIMTIAPKVEEWLLLLACDIPFFDPGVLRLLWENRSAGAAVVPLVNRRYQPFLGLYHRDVLPYWAESFHRGEYHLQRIVEAMPKMVLNEKHLADAGIEMDSFLNINTPADLQRIGG